MTERSVFWANHLKAIDSEGISARAYAAREGLAIQSLYQWYLPHQVGTVEP